MDFLHDHMSHPFRRSVLSVPGSNPRALEKVPSLDCDAVIFDLEDSVAAEMKSPARDNLRHWFSGLRPDGLECVIRINPLSGGYGAADMDLVVALRPDAVLLPKVEAVTDLEAAAGHLLQAGCEKDIALWAMIETPKGVLNAAVLAEAGRDFGLECLVVGLNDLRKATGVLPQKGRAMLVPWLMQVVLAGRAHGVDVIDSVFNDFRDQDGVEADCAQGRGMGFSGKMLIHPSQIEAANRHFGPDPTAIEEAKAIVLAFAEPAAEKLNVITLDGRMIERLHLQEAQRLIARAQSLTDRKKIR